MFQPAVAVVVLPELEVQPEPAVEEVAVERLAAGELAVVAAEAQALRPWLAVPRQVLQPEVPALMLHRHQVLLLPC